jgi:hypothetical protein
LFFDGSDEDHQILKTAARELLLDVDGDTGFEDSYGDNHEQHFLTELAVALLPNLEAFVVEIEYDIDNEDLVTCNRFLASRFAKLEGENGRPGLPNIRSLGFTKEDNWGFNMATPGIVVLLNAAPNLERLVFDGTYGVSALSALNQDFELKAPGLRNLRQLSITNSALGNSEDDLQFRQLRRVIQLCRWLEVFRFHSIGPFLGELDEGHLPPGRFIEALESVKPRLQVLDLDLTDSYPPEPADDWVLTTQSLASFRRLESLRLDEFSFCLHCVDDVTNQTPRANTTCLTAILPTTVRSLTVILVREGQAWNDLCHLGHVVDEEFPRLETVTVERKDKRGGRTMKHAVREAFAQSRVRLSFIDRDYYDGDTQFDDVYIYE